MFWRLRLDLSISFGRLRLQAAAFKVHPPPATASTSDMVGVVVEPLHTRVRLVVTRRLPKPPPLFLLMFALTLHALDSLPLLP